MDAVIIETFLELGPWGWYILALLLLGLELLAPGTFFLWFGISAFCVGTLNLAVPLPWQSNTLLFVGLALTSIVLSYQILRKPQSEQSTLNRRGLSYVGQHFVLRQPLESGRGHLEIGDTVWQITGPDLPIGSPVEVTGCSGTTLTVTPLRPQNRADSEEVSLS